MPVTTSKTPWSVYTTLNWTNIIDANGVCIAHFENHNDAEMVCEMLKLIAENRAVQSILEVGTWRKHYRN